MFLRRLTFALAGALLIALATGSAHDLAVNAAPQGAAPGQGRQGGAPGGVVQQAGGLTAASPRGQQGLGPFKTLTIRGVMLIDGTGAPPTGPVKSRSKAIASPNRQCGHGRSGGPPGRRGAAAGGRGQTPPAAADQHVLEAQGMYLMPGFVDMHVHAGGAPKNAEAEYAYKLWLAHGVTTVRGVSLGANNLTVRGKDTQREKRDRRATHLQLSAPRRDRSPENARAWVRQNASTSMD